jgi:hypothetical protein
MEWIKEVRWKHKRSDPKFHWFYKPNFSVPLCLCGE